MTIDPMGDRMKMYEGIPSDILIPKLPICVRLDGRAFHTFARKLDKPFDEGLCQLMVNTTKYLVGETKACIGYTQSDEISLILYYPDPNSQALFGGKIQKLCSVLSSTATANFVSKLSKYLDMGKVSSARPTFDCRVWNVPTEAEAANVILWRWFDARRNSISSLAQAHFSPKQLHKKNCKDMLLMLEEKGIVWADLPNRYKWGSFIRRENVIRQLTSDEMAKIPEKHRPTGPVTRSELKLIDLPSLDTLSNRVGVILHGDDAQLKEVD
jgi:tRNA(His) 5'-end guanylyltransferase